MTPEDFISKPWVEASLHPAYHGSFLHMRPAPEYASGEVVLASLYRNVGFDSRVTEGKTPQHGRDLVRLLEKRAGTPRVDNETLSADSWEGIIRRSLASPKQPSQATKRFLQICPVVPDAAIFSLSARLASNSWNPGSLVARAIGFGESDKAATDALWKDIFRRLSVDDDDDIWARFLQKQFESWRPKDLRDAWGPANNYEHSEAVRDWHSTGVPIPASRFVSDLRHILDLKQVLTRRQWISMLESVLRIGTASHVLWVCRANTVCFEIIKSVLSGEGVVDRKVLDESLGGGDDHWRYGQRAVQSIKDSARNFVVARAGLNLFMWHCEQLQANGTFKLPSSPFKSIGKFREFAEFVSSIREVFPVDIYREGLRTALEEDPRVVACKRGISSNVSEFLGHVLRQRQTSETGMDSYDQGYYLRKSGQYAAAPWIVSLGPVSVLALVHCCVGHARGPRTVEDFCSHLGDYGIRVRPRDVADGELGQTLRNLGLVLDSPDAEGGMVLVSPLKKTGEKN
jgi:hypothetical protein